MATDNDWKCGKCDGSGLIWRNAKTFGGKHAVGWQEWCPDCKGSGRKPESTSPGTAAGLLVGKAKGSKTCDTK